MTKRWIGGIFLAWLLASGSLTGAQETDHGEDEAEGLFLEVQAPQDSVLFDDLTVLLVPVSAMAQAGPKYVHADNGQLITELRPITVCFNGGSVGDRSRIASLAKVWEIEGSGVEFDFGDYQNPTLCPANISHDIRVGFGSSGTWSYTGAEARLNGDRRSTMEFDIPRIPPSDFNRAATHEFGHALGLYHEHQNPSANCENEIDWKKAPAVLFEEWGVTDEEVIANFRRLAIEGLIYSSYDAKSVMNYPLPKGIFRKELIDSGVALHCRQPKRRTISVLDREAIRQLYPEGAAMYELARLEGWQRFVSALDASGVSPSERERALAAAAALKPWSTLDESKYIDWVSQLTQENQIE